MNVGMIAFFAALLCFALTVGYTRVLIPHLRRRHAGQPILEIGPSWHLSKAGTPTLGGLGFIAAMATAALIIGAVLFFKSENSALRAPSLILLYALLCGAIGFFDDCQKLLKKQNMGLRAWQKYALQLLASSLFLFAASRWLGVGTSVELPFSEKVLQLGVFYYPLALLFLTGVVNAFNLTDGIDGLLSTTVAVVAGFLLLWGIGEQKMTQGMIGALLIGATLGFLCFNAHPAKVFMGDTGSLFLGAVVSGFGIVSGEGALMLIACGVFVIEAASVILQVLFFKITGGKRLFLMAPLHHHFEKKGWSEEVIDTVFLVAGMLFATVAFMGR